MTHLSALMSGTSAAFLLSAACAVDRCLSPIRDSLIPSRIAFLSTKYEIQMVRISAISSTAISKIIARVIAVSKAFIGLSLLRQMVARVKVLPAALRARQWGVLSLRPGTRAATLKG